MKLNMKETEKIQFGDIPPTFFLLGLLSEFMNRYQAQADTFFDEISWRQCFVLICLQFFKEPPTIGELSELVGTSHQNLKQLLNKLEKKGYVQFVEDEEDKRKQRIIMTEEAVHFANRNDQRSAEYVGELFSKVDMKDLECTIRTILQLDETLKGMKIK